MIRRASLVFAVLTFALAGASWAAPVRLARIRTTTPGRSPSATWATSGSRTRTDPTSQRITVNTAREVYPRFSPDGRWIAFSSNRYGNNDVFVVEATGGTPRRLTYHTGNDEVVGWSPDSQEIDLPVVARGRRVPGGSNAIPGFGHRRPGAPLPVDWGYWGSYSPDGKRLLFNRHPASGPASTTAAAMPPTSGSTIWRRRPTGSCSATTLQPLLADVGAERRDLLCGRPAAQRQDGQAGQPRSAEKPQQHLPDRRQRRTADPGDQAHRSATSSSRRCRATAR